MTTPLRLLLIEDSEDDALLIERELTKDGSAVECMRVDTPEAMQRALTEKTWDIITSDFVMPHFSGLDALGILKESGKDIPFIIVSGNICEETAVKAMRAGAHDYVIKGNLARLAPAVARELADAEVRSKRALAEKQREELELQFQQTQKLESLGVLAGGIAHDFNNILTIILGHCYMAQADIDSPELHEAHFEKIEIAANRAAELCRQMLTYAGKSQLVQTQVNMWLLIDETVKMLQAALTKNVVIELDLKRDVPEVSGDCTKIQQVIMNLIINAAEAIGDSNGIIKISLAKKHIEADQAERDHLGSPIPPGLYAYVEISDNGCGMDDTTKMRIFEPFFTTKFTGRGLGMSAILGIVKSHNGALQFSSTPGIGTTFKVYFPLPSTPVAAEALPVDIPIDSAPAHGTIILADDENMLRIVGTAMLTAMGFTVIDAANGREALEHYLQPGNRTDLMLLDLIMPEMGGLETYREVRKINSVLPVVLCSGYGIEEVYHEIKNDRYAEFIHKPYLPTELKSMLVRLIGEATEEKSI